MASFPTIAPPVMDSREEKRIRAGKEILQQQMMASAPATGQMNVNRVAQAAAPQMVAETAQAVQQGSAQQAENALAAGANAVQAQGIQQNAALEQASIASQEGMQARSIAQKGTSARADLEAQLGVTRDETAMAERLSASGIDLDNRLTSLSTQQKEDIAKLGRDVKAELFDSRLAFQRDETGRKFSNERQMLDYTVASAKSDEELRSRLQQMEQTAQREIYMLEAASKKLEQTIKQGWLTDEQELTQEHKRYLGELKIKMDKDIAKKKSKAAATGMVIGAAMAVGGAALIYSGVGAPAGAAMVSGGVSTMASSSQGAQ